MNMQTAKIFKNGESQAVRLPKAYRFDKSNKEVFIKKMDNVIILIPTDNPWQSLFDSVDKFTKEFMGERKQPKQQQRAELFK